MVFFQSEEKDLQIFSLTFGMWIFSGLLDLWGDLQERQNWELYKPAYADDSAPSQAVSQQQKKNTMMDQQLTSNNTTPQKPPKAASVVL